MAGALTRAVVVGVCAALVMGCHDSDDGAAASGAFSFEDVAWALASGGPTARFIDGTVSGWAARRRGC